MREVRYSNAAIADPLKYRSVARRLKSKVERYAQTGAGDVKQLIGANEKRLPDGDFRIVFVETETEILVIKIAPRGVFTSGDQMNRVQFIRSPSGDKLAVLPEDEYEALLDMRDGLEARAAAAAIARGELETLSSEELDAFLDATTPLAFWRGKRKLTQAALAKRVGISQSYLAGLEKGNRKGDPALFLKLARALNVPMEALVAED